MKIVKVFTLLLVITILSSCSKDEESFRDSLNGTWVSDLEAWNAYKDCYVLSFGIISEENRKANYLSAGYGKREGEIYFDVDWFPINDLIGTSVEEYEDGTLITIDTEYPRSFAFYRVQFNSQRNAITLTITDSDGKEIRDIHGFEFEDLERTFYKVR